MKNLTKSFFLFVILLLIISACSKEKKLEKNLYSDGGKWNVVFDKYEIFDTGASSHLEVYKNTGYVVFKENGKYTWTSTFNTITKSSGTWTKLKGRLIFVRGKDTMSFEIMEESTEVMAIKQTLSGGYSGNEQTYILNKVK